MSTVHIKLTGLFLVVPTGNNFTILVPESITHLHHPPIVGINASIEDVEVDLTRVLPRGAENIPLHTTVPVKTHSGSRPIKSGLLTDPLPLPELHGRIKLPKPHRIWPGKTSAFNVPTHPPLVASNELHLEYQGYSQTSLTVQTRSGPEVFNDPGTGLIQVPFLHRAVHEPPCHPGILAHHVAAYYELLEGAGIPVIPELADSCPAGFASLEVFPNVHSALQGDNRFVGLATRYEAAITALRASLSTFTCLVGSDT